MYASRHAADASASSDKVLAPAVQQDKRQRRLAPVTNGSCARQPARVVGSQELGKGEATGGRASPVRPSLSAAANDCGGGKSDSQEEVGEGGVAGRIGRRMNIRRREKPHQS